MTFLARYWRVLGIAAALAAALTLFTRCTHQAEQRGYERARAEMAVQLARANAKSAADEAASRKRVQEIESANQKALADLDARYAARRVPAVRVCVAAAGRGELPAPTRPATFDNAAATADQLPQRATADIGPDLERLVRAADEQTQRLIACQAYVTTLQK